MYLILVGLLEVLPLHVPIKETFKSSVSTVVKPAKKPAQTPVDSFEVKLGCLSDKEEAVYRYGKLRKKRFYHLKPLIIKRPDWGITEEKILCDTCGQNLYVTVYSRMANRLKRLSALGFTLLPVTVFGIASLLFISIQKSMGASPNTADTINKVKGFALIIFLALVWMIPVFLPVIFRKEYKLALRLPAEKGDRQHRFFETNVESVTQETYYK